MAINEGRQAHEHALKALSYLLNEKWTYEMLGIVRFELGQAYVKLKKHLKKEICQCGDRMEDLELYRSLLINVNTAITDATLRPIPVVVDQLKSYFAEKQETHNCICFIVKKHSMTNDF